MQNPKFKIQNSLDGFRFQQPCAYCFPGDHPESKRAKKKNHDSQTWELKPICSTLVFSDPSLIIPLIPYLFSIHDTSHPKSSFKMSGNNPTVGKLDVTLKAMQHQRSAAPESGKSGLLRRLTGCVKAKNDDQRRREEKAERLMHLICWGPN